MTKALVWSGFVVAVVAGAAAWLQAAAPQIDAVDVNPAYIVINTPTTVVFTAKITDPSLQPAGLNLLQTDSSGKTLSTVGVMNDAGTNGDAAAGDKIFSRSLPLNHAAVGQLHYRVSAPFKGVLTRTLSAVIAVTVDPVKLPPDPGEAGKQTLEGIDSDKDGVRDDVQRFIALTFPASTRIRSALKQDAVALQAVIASSGDSGQVQAAWIQAIAALQCLTATEGAKSANSIHDQLEAKLLNTSDRIRAHYDAARHPPIPDTAGRLANPTPDLSSYCTIDPDSLPN